MRHVRNFFAKVFDFISWSIVTLGLVVGGIFVVVTFGSALVIALVIAYLSEKLEQRYVL